MPKDGIKTQNNQTVKEFFRLIFYVGLAVIIFVVVWKLPDWLCIGIIAIGIIRYLFKILTLSTDMFEFRGHLKRLRTLKAAGILTDQEYETKREALPLKSGFLSRHMGKGGEMLLLISVIVSYKLPWIIQLPFIFRLILGAVCFCSLLRVGYMLISAQTKAADIVIVLDHLKQLRTLTDAGVLTELEYEAKRNALTAKLMPPKPAGTAMKSPAATQ
jgi:hypothetical protein